MSHFYRRRFLSGLTAGATALSMQPAFARRGPIDNPIVIFAKHVQSMDFDTLGSRLKAIGVHGIEATLRKGGQIEPENLAAQLGRLCAALARHDQRVVIAASDINEVNTASETYLSTLAKHDVPYFRMAYYRYDFDRPILPQLDEFARKANRLAEFCEAVGVTGLYQNHAGKNYVGAALWDLQNVLSGIDPQHLAVAIDVRHASLELSQSFQAAYLAVRPQLGATYVKDFDWIEGRAVNVPLGQGRAKRLFELIQSDGFVGPLSLHMEYTDHKDPSQMEKSWEAISADVKTLHRWLTRSK